VRLITDQGNNHAVEVEEEHQEMEAELDEGFPLVDVELAENLSGVQKVLVVKDLLSVVGEQRQVQDNRKPVAIDNEQEGQESMNSSLGDNVGVETVAEFDGVEVVTFQIAVHNGEKDLKEQVDGIDQDRQQIEPRFARHFDLLRRKVRRSGNRTLMLELYRVSQMRRFCLRQ
jgi:TPP-dependent indolepyruvate ferredoxin oxidoreductase alpha subunit